jgi:Cu(I)/Ag(I) efflux system membrane protein CusA/SilA
LRQVFAQRKPDSVAAIRRAALEAGVRRIRPCLMTAATTVLALIPVLTASGRGADIMMPMAIPTFGGMIAVVLTLQIVPVLYSAVEELKLRFSPPDQGE